MFLLSKVTATLYGEFSDPNFRIIESGSINFYSKLWFLAQLD